MGLHHGVISTTTDVWRMLSASREGDLDRVEELAQRCPALLTCQYNYMPPLHLAVREGHLDLARYLVQRGALDPAYRAYPFKDSIFTIAEDRGHDEILELLNRTKEDPGLTNKWTDVGEIDYRPDETQRRFQAAVDKGMTPEVETLLNDRPELTQNELAFWGEGVLMMPAKDGNREMLELLMRHGARVPDVSKWAPYYYFKHYETAAFLMESGMNPNHMNCHHVTLLHFMAYMGELPKVRLLLDHGADIDAIDEEYRSTPLGLAARWGQREMVAYLLGRGADPDRSGAPWATPLAWARKKGHADIEGDLSNAGAQDPGAHPVILSGRSD